jgi:hypothetical protein
MSETPMTPERLAEIRYLLRCESPIAFYSHRAKESMLLLVEEAEDAARLRKQVAELEADAAMLAALEAGGVDNWEGYSDAVAGAS